MNQKTKRILREEVGRTAVWLFFSVIGWSLVLNATPDVSLSLPVLSALLVGTAVAMSGVVVAVRLATGRELKGGTESKDLLLLTTTFLVGFYLAWAYLSANWTTMTSVLVVVLVLTVVVRVVRPSALGIESSRR